MENLPKRHRSSQLKKKKECSTYQFKNCTNLIDTVNWCYLPKSSLATSKDIKTGLHFDPVFLITLRKIGRSSKRALKYFHCKRVCNNSKK